MRKILQNFLSFVLILTTISGLGGEMTADAATESCKIMDVSFSDVLIENTSNTMNITVGSLQYSGAFTIEVYEGGKERQKIYEDSASVSSYDWEREIYGQTVVSVPVTAHGKGIVPYEIYLTPANGETILNRVVFRVYGKDEMANVLMITDEEEQYSQIRKLLQQKGAEVLIVSVPQPAQISEADLVLLGTAESGKLSDAGWDALADTNLLLYKNGDIPENVNRFLTENGSHLQFAQEFTADDITTQEYGNCITYRIIDPDLEKDQQIKNLFFHIGSGSAVTAAKSTDDTEAVVMADSEQAVLITELLPNRGKTALAGSDFFRDAETALSPNGMYEQAFANESYDPTDMRIYSNYNVASNLLDWLLPQPSYPNATIAEVKNNESFSGTYVSVSGTVVTPSESVVHNGTAFKNCIYLQDETGGIRIYGINRDVGYAYPTWKLNVKGYVSSYGGEKEIVVYDQLKDLTIVSRNDHAVEPQNISASQIPDSTLIGNLVRMTGIVSAVSDGSLCIRDDSGEATVFVDDYIGAGVGNWDAGAYDPRIVYGCTVEVTGILSLQNGDPIVRIYDTANIVLKLDQNGNAVDPPGPKSSRRFGGGLVKITNQTETATVIVDGKEKIMTGYMKLIADLGIVQATALPDMDLPVSGVLPKMINGMGLAVHQNEYDTSVRGGALQILSSLGYDYFFAGEDAAVQEEKIINQTGILDGIVADPLSALTTKDAARMVYNVLQVPFFGVTVYSSAGNRYGKLDQCILDNLDLTRADVLISETHYTNTHSTLPEHVVKASFKAYGLDEYAAVTSSEGEDLFYCDLPGIEDYIGQWIEVFIRDDTDNDRNIIAMLDNGRSTVYRLPQEDYVGFVDHTIQHVDESGIVQRLSVSSDAKLYINGIYSGTVNADSLMQPYEAENTLSYLYGWYRMIDHNSDGKVDSIFAEVYQDCIVSAINRQTGRVDNKLSDVPSAVFLDPAHSEEFHVVYEKSTGEAASAADIEKGDVLSIAAAKTDGQHLIWAKVVITKGALKGEISAINKTDMQLELNGEWYDYIEINPLRQDDFLFNVGDEGTFYVNMQGIVIMKDLKSMPYINYAFVIDFGLLEEAFEQTPAMRAYLPDGRLATYHFAETVTVRDGSFSERLKHDAFIEKYLRNTDGSLSKNTRTLVNYELNEEDEISSISFPFNNDTGKNDKGRLTLDRKYNQPAGENMPQTNAAFSYDAALKCIGDAFLSEDTVIFDVALEESEALQNAKNIQDKIQILPVSALIDGTAPTISLFDMGDGNVCAAAITVNASRLKNAASNLFLVNNTLQALDAEQNEVTEIFGYEKGEQKQMMLADDAVITNLLSGEQDTIGSGDLILYSLDEQAQVTEVQVVLNTAMAKHYLPDVYGNGSMLLPKVNFYSDDSNPKQIVRYYYGLVTEKYQNGSLGKLVLARDNTSYPSTLLERLTFAPIIATNDETVFYRINQEAEIPVTQSDLSDVITAPSGSYGIRTGDLAVVKTVNNLATDVILISPAI